MRRRLLRPRSVAEPDTDIRRVLIGLSGAGDEWAYLDTAIDLAERLQAELTALFIEDADLLRASMLPCAREIDRHSARTNHLDLARMERSLRQAATKAEARLRRSAEARALRFSFQVIRGRPTAQLLDLAERMDAVLLAPSVWEGRGRRHKRPVAVVYEAGEQGEHTLSTAVGLARGADSPLHVLIPADDEASYRQALSRAHEHAAGLEVTAERMVSAGALPERINRIGAALLVAHVANGADAAELNRLRGRLCCDLLLLR